MSVFVGDISGIPSQLVAARRFDQADQCVRPLEVVCADSLHDWLGIKKCHRGRAVSPVGGTGVTPWRKLDA